MSRIMRKPMFCICENKDADQLRGNCEADQHLCFCYKDSMIPLLSKSKISSLEPSFAVFTKTAGLSDKTAKFQKCQANFVSLPDSMSDKKSIQKTPRQCFWMTWSSMKKIAHIDCIFTIKFAVLTEYKRPVFEQSRTLLYLSDIFLFCLTKIFRLSNTCPATPQKILRRLLI